MDASHNFGADLNVSATGDLALVDGAPRGQQRVLRRLLTNPDDYLWQPEYGAGLPRFIGQPANAQQLAGITRAQMRREASVALTPEPVITVRVQPDGVVYEQIQYADADTGATQILSVPVSG